MPNIDEKPTHRSNIAVFEHNTLESRFVGPELAAGTFVGRYQIVEKLATGGMGILFRAYDPELSRHVALKLVLPSSMAMERAASMEEYEQRLLREAQVLARLSHPNVVAAFDVGKVAGVLFIAMELIDGGSLRAWLTGTPRAPAEVLPILLDAGRGLSAAHRAGVVHRDFKLSNVMVSNGGRVLVVDFGLARTTGTVVESALAGASSSSGAEASLGTADSASGGELTRTGAIVGTAGYIAPEQFEGGPSDERSDQFSYASAAFRALTGVSAYPADSIAGYRAALLQGTRAAWPHSIPRSIRRVIDRGLSRDPAARYPTLDALLDDLDRAARPRRLLVLVAAALGLSALAVSVAVRQRFIDPCEIDSDAFERAWSADQRAAVESSFSSSGNPRARDTFALLDARLLDYRTTWQTAKHEACVAAHVRRDQSEQVLDLRNACLDGKVAQLGIMVRLFQQPDAALVDRAPEALDSIAQLRECSDVAGLVGESERLPDDPVRRSQVRDLQQRWDTLEAVFAAGRWSESLEQAQALENEAERIGYLPIKARAMARALTALERLGRRAEADVLRRRTLEVASEAKIHDVVAQLAVRFLLVAVDGERIQEAKALIPLVDADVRLAGRPPALQIRLLTYEAAILTAEGNFDAAIQKLELALAECRQLGKEGARSCLTPQRELGLVHAARQDYVAARVELEAAVAIAQQAYGPGHPSLLNEYNNLGYIMARWGDLDTAARALAESKALAASLPENRQTSNIPEVEGLLMQRRGDLVGALSKLEEAVRRRGAAYGDRTIQVATARYLLGVCLASLGRTAEAIAELEAALEIDRTVGAPARLQAEASFSLAEALWVVPAQRPRAITLARSALELFEKDGTAWAVDAQGVKTWLDAHAAGSAQ
jgi:serine/threonine protein kinase/tetratricopeptide (TPR) repeat protein